MSESSFFPPNSTESAPAPAILVGASWPLWGYYVGAATGGLAWWWMTRWTEPANLEALFGAAERAGQRAFGELEAPPLFREMVSDIGGAFEAAAEQAADAANDLVAYAGEGLEAPSAEVPEAAEVTAAIVEPVLPPRVVGGEAGPISPLAQSMDLNPEEPEPRNV